MIGRLKYWLYGAAFCLAFVSAVSPASAQEAPFEPAFLDVAHLTCNEVWEGVDKQEKPFYQVVEVLTHHMLKKRDLTFPNDKKAGELYGEAIVAYCLDDPHELLFSVVARSLYDVLVPEQEKAEAAKE